MEIIKYRFHKDNRRDEKLSKKVQIDITIWLKEFERYPKFLHFPVHVESLFI